MRIAISLFITGLLFGSSLVIDNKAMSNGSVNTFLANSGEQNLLATREKPKCEKKSNPCAPHRGSGRRPAALFEAYKASTAV